VKRAVAIGLLVTAVGSVGLAQGLMTAFYEDRAPVLNVKVEVLPAEYDSPPSESKVLRGKYRCSVVVFADQLGRQSLAIHNVLVGRGELRSEELERGDLTLRFAVELRDAEGWSEDWAITSVEVRRGREVIGRQDSAILVGSVAGR